MHCLAPSTRFSTWAAWLLPTALLLGACVHTPGRSPTPAAGMAWDDARQLVLVTSADWNAVAGELRRFERDGDGWRAIGAATPVTLGRNGTAWGLGLHPAQAGGPQKREGDGRAPAGVFALGVAFGYGDSTETALAYQPMDVGDWCIDISDSPLYNRIVNRREVGEAAVEGSTEPMRRDLHEDGDVRYKLGFVIAHNPDAVPGGGSCIFAHLWREPGEATAGCTAMDEPAMRELLAWLDPAQAPVFVLLPVAERERLRAEWKLPDGE